MPYRTNCHWTLTLSFLAMAIPTPGVAADGSLKIRFLLDGEPPKPVVLPAAAAPKKADETVVLGPKKEIQNVVMWMWTSSTIKAPESEAANAALAPEVRLKIAGFRFEPHIVLLHTLQKLVIENTDPIGHNSHGVVFANAAFDELIPAGGKVSIVLPKKESRPQPVGSHIHPWMSACLLIRDNPYFGVSNAKGELTIPHIPEGKHTFIVWQEKKGLVDRGSQDGKRFDWKQGRMEVTIAGDTDLGTFEIPLDKTR